MLQKAIIDYPTNSTLWLLLSYAEYNLHNQNKALEAASQAYKYESNDMTYEVLNRIQNNLPLKINFTKNPQ